MRISSLPVLAPTRRIAQYLRNHPLYDEFVRLSIADDSTPPWPRFLRSRSIKYLIDDLGTNGRYVQRNGRTGGGMDRALDIPDHSARKLALRWRLNNFVTTAFCVCGERFTRNHVACSDETISSRFPFRFENVLNCRASLGLQYYSDQDHLLNSGRWPEFIDNLDLYGDF